MQTCHLVAQNLILWVVFAGLYNDRLDYQKDLDPDTVQMLSLFLHRHPSPVALVAHNGLAFDFGLLKTELETVATSRGLPPLEGLLCVDSLVLFKSLGEDKELDAITEADANTLVRETRDFSNAGSRSIAQNSDKEEAQLQFTRDTATSTECLLQPRVGEMFPQTPCKPETVAAEKVAATVKRRLFCDEDGGDEEDKKCKLQGSLSLSSQETVLYWEESREAAEDVETLAAPTLNVVQNSVQNQQGISVGEPCSWTPGNSLSDSLLAQIDIPEVTGEAVMSRSHVQYEGKEGVACCRAGSTDYHTGDSSTSAEACVLLGNIPSSNTTHTHCHTTTPRNTTHTHSHTTTPNNITHTPSNTAPNSTGLSNTTPSTPSGAHRDSQCSPSADSAARARKRPKLLYSLPVLHERILGFPPPASHRAEDDCLALVRLFQKTGQEALKWADDHATPYRSIFPMYTVRPRKPLPRGVFPYQY